MNYLKQFKEHISRSDYPKFLSLWEEYCLGDEIDTRELLLLLSEVKKSEFARNFGLHAADILPLWDEMPNGDSKHLIFKEIIDLQTSNSRDLATTVMNYLEKEYADKPHFQDKLRIAGLRDGQDFQGAISSFELLSHLAIGNFVFHTGGWGVGEIMDSSFLREQLSIEFDYVPGQKDLSFANSCKTLLPLPSTHFLARRFGNPDALEKLAKENPIEVMHMLLKDLGPKTASEIKEELFDLVIPESEWQKWWQTARTKMKKDTLIQAPESLKKPFCLREKEISHEKCLQAALAEKPDANTLISMLYAFVRDFPMALKSGELKESIASSLKDALSSEELTDAEELQIHFFLADLLEGKTYPAIAELVKRLPSIDKEIGAMHVLSFKKRCLIEVRTHRDDWCPLFLNLLLTVSQNPLRDYILDELIKGNDQEALGSKLDELLAMSSLHPNTFLWYFQKAMKSKTIPLCDQAGKDRLFESLLILLSHLEQTHGHRDLVKKIHNLVTTNKYAIVRKVMEGASMEAVHEFLLLATKCHSFDDHDIKIFHSLAEVVHPSLAKLGKKYEQDANEEEIVWTTEEGFNKVKSRMEHIATVETVDNAKEIEVARGHGDLRENAEFKSALERRDRLQSELKQLSDMANKARILTKDDVATDEVEVGAIVECKDPNGKMSEFTLLGPWEADPDNNILSIQSKLAQSLVGKKVGDHVTIQKVEYTIADIRNYFEE